MSEHEGGDGKVGAFLLGFLVGVLVCIGAGGVLFVVQARQMAMMREAAMQAEMEAREQVEAERQRTVQALEAERKARAAKAKEGN